MSQMLKLQFLHKKTKILHLTFNSFQNILARCKLVNTFAKELKLVSVGPFHAKSIRGSLFKLSCICWLRNFPNHLKLAQSDFEHSQKGTSEIIFLY